MYVVNKISSIGVYIFQIKLYINAKILKIFSYFKVHKPENPKCFIDLNMKSKFGELYSILKVQNLVQGLFRGSIQSVFQKEYIHL